MKKYKNTGGLVGFILDGKTYSFQNAEVVEVNNDFKQRVEEHLAKLVDITPRPPKPKILGEYPMKEVSPGVFEADLSKPHLPEGELRKLSFKKLRELGNAYGLKFRGREEAIRELLEAMK